MLSEHRPGDVVVTRPPAPARRRVLKPGFGRRLVADLQGDRESLARAIVLREILGPPVGLRPPDRR